MIDERSIRKELKDGTIEWRLPNGKLHRTGGPAIEELKSKMEKAIVFHKETMIAADAAYSVADAAYEAAKLAGRKRADAALKSSKARHAYEAAKRELGFENS